MAKRREVLKLLKFFDDKGRARPTATAMGVSISLVNKWLDGSSIPTTDHAIKAAVLTGGHVSAKKLKPDLDMGLMLKWFLTLVDGEDHNNDTNN